MLHRHLNFCVSEQKSLQKRMAASKKSDEKLLALLSSAIYNQNQDEKERLFQLILEKKLSFNDERADYPPLHRACWVGDAEITKKLLEHGADPDGLNMVKKCPLHYAAEFDREECARLVLDSGASVDTEEKYGRTPLYMAAEYKGDHVGDLLLAYGADPNQKRSGPLRVFLSFFFFLLFLTHTQNFQAEAKLLRRLPKVN